MSPRNGYFYTPNMRLTANFSRFNAISLTSCPIFDIGSIFVVAQSK